MTKRTMIIAAISAFVAFAAGYAMLGLPTTADAASRSAATPATTQLDAGQLAELLGAAGPQPRVVVLDGPVATLGAAAYQDDDDHDDDDYDHDDDDDDDDDDHHHDRKSDTRLASASSSDKKHKDRDDD